MNILELSIVLVLLAILTAVGLNRMWAIQADAERVSLAYFVASLKTALGIKVAILVARDDLAGMAALATSNPMELLSDLPSSYKGVRERDTAGIEGGDWYFDPLSRMLVYRVRNAEHFQGGIGPPAAAQFVLVPVYEDRNHNGRYDAGDRIQSVKLETVRPYRWGP